MIISMNDEGRHHAPLGETQAHLDKCLEVALAVKSQEIVHPGALCKAGCRQTTKPAEEATRMNIHKNARTTPHSRARIAGRVAAGERPAGIARDVGVCDRTVKKWVARAAEGELALEDRSCRPHHSPRAISTGLMVGIERLRRHWRWTGAQIAESVGVSRATAARTLRQLGLARLGPAEAVGLGRRYEWGQPGQLVHLDIKKLGVSAKSVIGSRGIAASGRWASVGSSSTSALTTAPASRTPSSCPMSAASRSSASCGAH